MLNLLAAGFLLAKRPVQRLVRDLPGRDILLDMVPKLERQTTTVLGPVEAELAEAVRSAPASHIDENPRRETNARAWLWIGTNEAVTIFQISSIEMPERPSEGGHLRPRTGGGSEGRRGRWSTCTELPESCGVGGLRSDGVPASGLPQAMIDRANAGSAVVGRSLPKRSNKMFWGWHQVANGELSWDDIL